MAIDFLTSIDVPRTLHSISAALLESSSKNPLVKETVRGVLKWMHESSFTGEQLKKYKQLGKKTSVLNLPDTPDFVKPMVTVIYMRTKTEILRYKGDKIEDFIIGNLAKVQPALDKFPKDLLGDISVKTELQVEQNPSFLRTLEAAANEIGKIGPDFNDHAIKWNEMHLDDPTDPEDCDCVVCGHNSLGDVRCFCIESWFECILILLGFIILIIVSL